MNSDQVISSNSSVDTEEIECSICLLPIIERQPQAMPLRCSHSFHIKCIVTWFENKLDRHEVPNCPLCRDILCCVFVDSDPRNTPPGLTYTSCSICLRLITKYFTTRVCHHHFCDNCINSVWTNCFRHLQRFSCPICRRQFSMMNKISLENNQVLPT